MSTTPLLTADGKAKSNTTGKHSCGLPIQSEMCATCPWREGSKFAYLVPDLTRSALTEATRICHSTGSNNGVYRRTGKPSAVCRGARDVQLQHFKRIGFLDNATDEAWAAKWKEMQSR